MTTGAGKPGSLERYGEKNHPEWFKKLQPQGPAPTEPTSKSSALKSNAPGNKDAMAPKDGYKDKRKA